MTSLCDKCFAPGQCCKHLQLFGKDGHHITFWLDEGLHGALMWMITNGLPFTPVAIHSTYIDEKSGEKYFAAEYNCPWLLSNGRCGSYDDRPDICRDFEPGETQLCVHWRGAEAGAL